MTSISIICLLFGLVGHSVSFSVRSSSGGSNTNANGLVTLFSRTGCKGFYLPLKQAEIPVVDLKTHGFENMAYSIKFQGRYILYETSNYNGEGSALVEIISASANSCVDLKQLKGKVNSIHALGEGSIENPTNTLTLFDGIALQGKIHTAKTQLEVPTSVKSLAIGGTNGWTLYSKSNLQGARICIQPDNSASSIDPAIVIDLGHLAPPIAYDFIKSVKIGCESIAIPVHIQRKPYQQDSITFYDETELRGIDSLYSGSYSSVSFKKASSLAIAGRTSWTLFSLPNYRGRAVCLQPEYIESKLAVVKDTLKLNPSIPYDFVKSIKAGPCDPVAVPIIIRT